MIARKSQVAGSTSKNRRAFFRNNHMIDEPEMPPHVLENYLLDQRLEGEFLGKNRRTPRHFRKGHSSVAKRRFNSPESRESFWKEYVEAMKDPGPTPPYPARELTYEDVITSWGPGCGPTGQSALARKRSPTARSEDDGVL